MHSIKLRLFLITKYYTYNILRCIYFITITIYEQIIKIYNIKLLIPIINKQYMLLLKVNNFCYMWAIWIIDIRYEYFFETFFGLDWIKIKRILLIYFFLFFITKKLFFVQLKYLWVVLSNIDTKIRYLW